MENDLINQGKRMVVEYYNRYVMQRMNRHPRYFKKKIGVDDVLVKNHSFADNVEEVELYTKDDETLIYRVLKDIETNQISSYTIKRKQEEDD